MNARINQEIGQDYHDLTMAHAMDNSPGKSSFCTLASAALNKHPHSFAVVMTLPGCAFTWNPRSGWVVGYSPDFIADTAQHMKQMAASFGNYERR